MKFLPSRKKNDKSPEAMRLELLQKQLKATKNANRRANMKSGFRTTMKRVAIQPKDKEQRMEWMFGRGYTEKVMGRRVNK